MSVPNNNPNKGAVPPVISPPKAPRPDGPPARQRERSHAPGLLATMGVVAAGMFLALKLGFLLHGDPQPWPISSTLATAIAALVFTAGICRAGFLAFAAIRRASARARYRKEARLAMAEAAAARRRRAAELADNPATAKYAPLVERGEDWPDDKIAYAEDPQATVTCVHLQPIERAIRAAGIAVRPFQHTQITAACVIDLPALRSIFGAVSPVRYAEFYAGDRYEFEHPAAFLICDEHKSMIHTLHPDEAGPGNALTFPA